ncbi:hypothetical protein HMPREF3182_01048 [Megasphaera hutchinsoni]|jgi:hypothetical protein|uniref:Putative regulatory protein HMPREF3182_01048 n=2 Tax=Megasphaera hutchinsoni TaxID=1588748 RepID=A0A134CEI8_9FIRM|nr:hypothetical protein HMPREF3182_01048 [Megasphaera hutchinsoni]
MKLKRYENKYKILSDGERMSFNLLNIGFGNMVMGNKVVAIISPESAPIKRMIQEAREGNRLIDATFGRKTRALLIMDNGQIILSALQAETISHRLVTVEPEDTVE